MRYLIYCGPGIGDFVLILPMVQLLKRNDPSCYIQLFVCSSKERVSICNDLLKIQKYIDSIDYYSVKEIFHDIIFLVKMKYKKFDIGFSLQYTNSKQTSCWPSRIINLCAKKTIGIRVDQKDGICYDKDVPLTQGTHVSEYPIMMCKKILGDSFIECDIDYSSLINKKVLSEYAKVNFANNKFISIVVGTAPVSGCLNNKYYQNSAKQWDYLNWVKLSKKLSNDGYDVVLLGGRKEEIEFSSFNDELKKFGIVNLLGKCEILKSISILSSSLLAVGGDTGLMHCAGALNIPSLTLYGCTDYREYLPFGNKANYMKSDCSCSPCFGTNNALTCNNHVCMKNITVDSVYCRIKEILLK